MKKRNLKSRSKLHPIIEGIARSMDLTGSFSHLDFIRIQPLGDFEAIQSDWETVGQDLWAALNTVKKELPANGY